MKCSVGFGDTKGSASNPKMGRDPPVRNTVRNYGEGRGKVWLEDHSKPARKIFPSFNWSLDLNVVHKI